MDIYSGNYWHFLYNNKKIPHLHKKSISFDNLFLPKNLSKYVLSWVYECNRKRVTFHALMSSRCYTKTTSSFSEFFLHRHLEMTGCFVFMKSVQSVFLLETKFFKKKIVAIIYLIITKNKLSLFLFISTKLQNQQILHKFLYKENERRKRVFDLWSGVVNWIFCSVFQPLKMRYSLMTAVSVNVLTVTMLLNVLIDPGELFLLFLTLHLNHKKRFFLKV